MPSDWKHAVVTPIHKAGPKTLPSNIRPISVLPVFSKILKRAVHQMIYKYLQEDNLLSSHQSGFRSLHSTSTCLTHITNNLLHNIDKGYLTGLVFLGLSKAFDTFSHNVMLDKLSLFGFLSIQFGILQGRVLGPLLLIMYINPTCSKSMQCRALCR